MTTYYDKCSPYDTKMTGDIFVIKIILTTTDKRGSVIISEKEKIIMIVVLDQS